jgi:hypothetical protein
LGPLSVELQLSQRSRGKAAIDNANSLRRRPRDAPLVKVLARFSRLAFTVGGEPSLHVPPAGPHVFGLGMAKDKQGESLVHAGKPKVIHDALLGVKP